MIAKWTFGNWPETVPTAAPMRNPTPITRS